MDGSFEGVYGPELRARWSRPPLDETRVDEVWGVGPADAELLKEAGVATARKLRDADRRLIGQLMTVVGARPVEELRGIGCLPLGQCAQ